MNDLVIVGAGGHGREVLQLVRDLNAELSRWNVLGFVDDAPLTLTAGRLADLPFLGSTSLLGPQSYSVVVAIGAPWVRRSVVARLRAQGVTIFATLVHPSVQLGRGVQIGAGSVICAGAILTTDIKLGEHVLVNTAAVVSHDNQLASFVSLAPRATLCGDVRLGEGAEVGASATLLQGCRIGAWAKIGAAACVLGCVEANQTVVGVPARVVRQREQGWQDA